MARPAASEPGGATLARLVRYALLFPLLLVAACGDYFSKDDGASGVPIAAPGVLDFTPEVIEVTDGVHVAYGYGLANSIMIEGDGGVVIVDTMESPEAARAVLAAFREITSDPVRAIVYTHNHADHVFGARVFAEGRDVDVFAHATTVEELDRVVNVLRPAIFTRSMRQFGTYLSDDQHAGCGIGPRLDFSRGTVPDFLVPNRTFDGDRMEVEVAGVRMVLVHAPGETPDQIFVWLPDKKALLPGDNWYRSFPNLYAIRGTAYRDVMDWVRSVDAMRDLGAKYLIPGHTRPVSGFDEVETALAQYRDAIQFVHDQTVRGINAGKTADELAESIRLPSKIAASDYLVERYGRVDWSVRSIFTGYLGWFGGNATDLSPLSGVQAAERLVALAGDRERLAARAVDAFDTGDHRWSLKLADALLLLDPDDETGRRVRSGSLRALAANETSANGRNYYLTQALETESRLEIEPQDPSELPAELLDRFPMANIMAALPVNLDADASADTDRVIEFTFPDIDEVYTLHVRHGVARLRKKPSLEADIKVRAQSRVWKEVLTGHRSAVAAVATGAVTVEGGVIELGRVLAMFRS